ncbi:MAG: MotA/TolQ/ExbB proton channel family protein [Hydrocarboniphaga sp.]|uniref:MotA/TolQ/ExbB proton channel family protein n=1 Tax=Hydrocarboniphaga sp. TaxID=2033016 RepID=UPI0026384CDF|nr:MotA/TolQ/ExbB proton channel family protein [Hydrocarboniphaga sp.]MDB5973184.1 MotA/TolQ/ExbB proton channel family protein [Hydrocarboniphaga sp.]
MSRSMSRTVGVPVAMLMLFAASLPAAYAVAPGNLDELLEQTRSLRDREAAANKEREAKFLAERNKQSELLAQAKAELSELQRRQQSLSASFDSNEKKLTELQAQLDAKSGNMGEMFGVVRQVANDFSSVVRNSMISAQYPDREAFVSKLAATKALPSISDLERFWFELQREMTETGSVVRFKSMVVQPDGASVEQAVSRVGSFTAVSDGKYLAYLPSEHKLAVMARQPGGKFASAASDLSDATSGYVGTELDPTRGVLLTIYAQRPNWIERIKRGEAVNYVILLVGIVGALLGIYQFVYLMGVRAKVKTQLTQVGNPTTDNPLGRVLSSFKGDGSRIEEDAEVVELRISEAVLREVPPLERFQAFLRLAVAAGPLLGLIGTVIGMIITFQSITESGSSDPKLMAAGISAAMIATVLGLGIAIPLLFANAWLTSLSKQIIQILDEQSTGLLAERLEGKTGA